MYILLIAILLAVGIGLILTEGLEQSNLTDDVPEDLDHD